MVHPPHAQVAQKGVLDYLQLKVHPVAALGLNLNEVKIRVQILGRVHRHYVSPQLLRLLVPLLVQYLLPMFVLQ